MTPTPEVIETIKRAMAQHKGDDLERAEMSFGHMGSAERGKQWGQSGNTINEVLEGYRRHRRAWQDAMDFVNGLA